MANKTFRERLFLCLIGLTTHSVGGVRGLFYLYFFNPSSNLDDNFK